MSSNSRTKKRLCSKCKQPGHNRRRCTESSISYVDEIAEIKRSLEEPILEEEHNTATFPDKTSNTPKLVVCNSGDMPASPHVINLRNSEREKALRMAPVYQEQQLRVENKPLNFADLIRRANKNAAEATYVATKPKKKRKLPPVHVLKDESVQIEPLPVTIDGEESHEAPVKRKSILASTLKSFFKKFTNNGVRKAPPRRVYAYGALAMLLALTPLVAGGYYQKVKRVNEEIIAQSLNAFMHLGASTAAAMEADLDKAEADLNQTLVAFEGIQALIQDEYKIALPLAKSLPIIGKHVKSREALLVAGENIAQGNTYILKGISAMQVAKESSFTDQLAALEQYMDQALPYYEKAAEALNTVGDEAIPEPYERAFNDFSKLFGQFVGDVEDVRDLVSGLQDIFGQNSFQRYLVVFQNNHEIRPTGGFMGSFGVFDVQKGDLKNVSVPPGGSYDLQGSLDVFLKPPTPLQLTNSRWEFQDANWFPDFSASAKKAAWFYQHSQGATVDGVIAVNASVLERVLRVIGDIELKNDQYDLVLDSDSALETIQEEVEFGEGKKENKPKAVLGELTGQFIDLVYGLDSVDALKLVVELYSALSEKEVQVYFADDSVQELARDFGWTGEITEIKPFQDYLMVVDTNIIGSKTDARIEQHVEQFTTIAEDGSVTNKVVVKRTHTGEAGDELYGVTNVDYMRIYVPEGAELIDAGGFEFPPDNLFHVPENFYEQDADLARIEYEIGIHEKSGTRITKEFGKNVFGNWVMTEPGETSEIYVTYRLPFSMHISKNSEQTTGEKVEKLLEGGDQPTHVQYQLVLQKQSGTNRDYTLHITHPSSWNISWTSAEGSLLSRGFDHSSTLTTDTVLGIIFSY